MKTRVYKYGKYYFPQYKGLIFWKYIFEASWDGESSVYFNSMQEAVDYLNKGNWHKYSEVVWESE